MHSENKKQFFDMRTRTKQKINTMALKNLTVWKQDSNETKKYMVCSVDAS